MIFQYFIIIGVNNIVDNDVLVENLSEEEQIFIKCVVKECVLLEEELVMCCKMFILIELVQDCCCVVIIVGCFSEDICGYDQCLDIILVCDVFVVFVKLFEGEVIFVIFKLGDFLGEEDELI